MALLLSFVLIHNSVNLTAIHVSAQEAESLGKESAVSEEHVIAAVDALEAISDSEVIENMTTDGVELGHWGDDTVSTYTTGTPYAETDGAYQYDVETPHVLINQVYV